MDGNSGSDNGNNDDNDDNDVVFASGGVTSDVPTNELEMLRLQLQLEEKRRERIAAELEAGRERMAADRERIEAELAAERERLEIERERSQLRVGHEPNNMSIPSDINPRLTRGGGGCHPPL